MNSIISIFRNSLILYILILRCFLSYGQDTTITTAFPFLLINSDARSGGMGDLGVATSADAFSQYWNPAKYLFLESHSSLGFSHASYLREIGANINLSNITFSSKGTKRGVWSGSINYFNYGQINFSKFIGDEIVNQGAGHPSEWNANLSYSLLLSERFAMGITTKYIHSNLKSFADEGNNIHSLGFDISGFHQSNELVLSRLTAVIRSGFIIANIGPRNNLDDGISKEFLPTNLRAGIGITFLLEKNQLSFNFEASKLLVPNRVLVSPETENEPAQYQTQNISFISGIFKSLNDAPDGFLGEFNEVGWSFGTEYVFSKTFIFRAGSYNESLEAGHRQYYTVGTGFESSNFTFDFSYLIGRGSIISPLHNSIRFSLSYNINK